jgi:hypothetical protein
MKEVDLNTQTRKMRQEALEMESYCQRSGSQDLPVRVATNNFETPPRLHLILSVSQCNQEIYQTEIWYGTL